MPSVRVRNSPDMLEPISSISWQDVAERVRTKYSPTSAAPMLSDVHRVLRDLITAERRIDSSEAQKVIDHEDLRGLLARAVAFARVQAKTSKHVAGGRRASAADANRASRVAVVARLVVPECVVQRRGRQMSSAIPVGWRPVLKVVLGSSVASGAMRRHLEIIITSLVRHGINEPAAMPADPEALYESIVAENLVSRRTITNALSGLRRAIRQCIEQQILPADTPVPAKLRGHKRRRGGVAWYDDPCAMLRAKLPLWADDLDEFEALTPDKLGGMPRRRRLAVYRVASALVDMFEARLLPPEFDLKNLQMCDLATIRIPRRSGGETSPLGSRMSRAAVRNGLRVPEDSIPLVEAIGAWMTDQVRKNSAGVGVPPIVTHDIRAVWAICAALLRPLPGAAVERRVQWEVQHETIGQWLNRADHSRSGVPGMRDKELLAEHLSLPLTIVFGLPFYTLLELPLIEREMLSYTPQTPKWSALENRYHRLFDEWLALSTKLADPLRVEQRVYGRVGGELSIYANYDGNGDLVQISGVTSHFAGKAKHANEAFGLRNPMAGLKQHQKGTRSWDWPPSIVNFDWLVRYFREIWYARVRRRGESGTLQEAMTSGRWTLFPSTSQSSTSHPWGGMKGDWISAKTGDALLRVMRDALGHTHIPTVRQVAIQSGWRMLLSDHNIRHLWASYWGGLRDVRGPRQVRSDGVVVESVSGMDYCRRATTDEVRTIQTAYIALTQTIQRLLTRTVGSWDHPLSHDSVMDRVTLTDQAVDWAAEWDRLAIIRDEVAMPPHLRSRWEASRSIDSNTRIRSGRRQKQR